MKHNRPNLKETIKFIEIDSQSCEACWKCISICPEKVLGKINILFHKHSKISYPDKCTGCMKCVRVCEYKAIKQVNKIKIAGE